MFGLKKQPAKTRKERRAEYRKTIVPTTPMTWEERQAHNAKVMHTKVDPSQGTRKWRRAQEQKFRKNNLV